MAGIEVATGELIKKDGMVFNKEFDLTIESIVDTVNELQCIIYDQSGTEYFDLTVLSNGFVHIIEFVGIQIWNSDDDERTYIEVGDPVNGMPNEVRETLDSYLRRIIMGEISKMVGIKMLITPVDESELNVDEMYELNEIIFYLIDNKIHSAPIISRKYVENLRDDASTNAQLAFYVRCGKTGISYITCHAEVPHDKAFLTKEALQESL